MKALILFSLFNYKMGLKSEGSEASRDEKENVVENYVTVCFYELDTMTVRYVWKQKQICDVFFSSREKVQCPLNMTTGAV